MHVMAERYLAGAGSAAVASDVSRIKAAAARLSEVRLVQSVYLPGDELCLYLFESDSVTTVAELGRLAELDLDRIRSAEVAR